MTASMAIRLAVLGSGSGGNATFIEAGGVRLLLDAGFSLRSLVQRLRFLAIAPESLDAILITHEHGDHIHGAAAASRSFGLPIYCTVATARAASLATQDCEVRPVRAGEPFAIGELRVRPFAVPHDAVDTVGYVVESGGARLGYATDLGHGPDGVRDGLRDCDVLILESNHDVEMLQAGPYPEVVKRRVLGRHGHLDNEAASDLLCDVVSERTRTVVLAHLSRTNNRPDLALQAAERGFRKRGFAPHGSSGAGRRTPLLHAAEQTRPSPWFEA
jgi:phosphoribosyl 1,2-cyclic phosphodiesterase